MLARWPRLSFYSVIALVLALDQATKMWATESLRPLMTVTLVPGFFNLTYVRNTGIAFGMFASPNSSSIMGSVPAEERGVASGMRSTFQNAGTALSISVFFTLVIAGILIDLVPSLVTA